MIIALAFPVQKYVYKHIRTHVHIYTYIYRSTYLGSKVRMVIV